MTQTFQQIGTDIGGIVTAKNAAYGSSFATAGDALRLLYPAGLQPEQFDDALLLVRIWDKMMRIATDRDALGEDPCSDIAGYGILGVHMHQQKRSRHATPCASASGAEPPLQGQSDFVGLAVPRQTMPTANVPSAPLFSEPSKSASPNTSASMASTAPTAANPSSSREDAPAKLRALDLQMQILHRLNLQYPHPVCRARLGDSLINDEYAANEAEVTKALTLLFNRELITGFSAGRSGSWALSSWARYMGVALGIR